MSIGRMLSPSAVKPLISGRAELAHGKGDSVVWLLPLPLCA